MPSQDLLTNYSQAFENTSTNVAAAQMRNALTNLGETVKDPEEKKVIFLSVRSGYHLQRSTNHEEHSSSRLKWTTFSHCSADTLTIRLRATLCMYS